MAFSAFLCGPFEIVIINKIFSINAVRKLDEFKQRKGTGQHS